MEHNELAIYYKHKSKYYIEKLRNLILYLQHEKERAYQPRNYNGMPQDWYDGRVALADEMIDTIKDFLRENNDE